MRPTGGWETVRAAIRQSVGPSAFKAWFGGLEGRVEADTLVLFCPDRFSRDWIRGRYGRALEDASPDGRAVDYRIASRGQKGSAGARSKPRAAEPRTAALPGPTEASFDSFVVEPGNALALEAARAVARGEAGGCSPLVLAGESGVGKTHLCRAIRSALGDRVVYRSSEEFTSEVTRAMRSDQMPKIRQRYRRALNVLILEDVQFLQGKRATQVELFHTLDHLISHGKPVVLSADCLPRDIAGLDAKLASRMTSGLVARISAPELPARRAILRAKAAAGGVRVPDECLELLAKRPVGSARDLIAGLNQVVARATLLKEPITPDLVGEALAAVEVSGRARSPEEIMQVVARSYGVSVEEILGRSRRRRVVQPRQLAMYLSRRYTDISLKEIGQAFGRDHTSVIYAVDVVERRVVEQPQLRYELEALAARFSCAASTRTAARRTRGTRLT